LPDWPLTIGWIGTPGNERYLDLIAEPLRVCAIDGVLGYE
jgi:hypothetical protein